MSPGNQYPPLQTSIPSIVGSPEGVIKAKPGQLIIDEVGCNLYIKQSPVDYYTGWAIFMAAPVTLAGGPNLIGTADPEGVVPATPGTHYWAVGTQKEFVKNSGTGSTDWQ